MAHQFTTSYLKDAIALFGYYKRLGDSAIAQCPDEKLGAQIDPESNSVAIIVKHMAGNMRSRWSNFLTTDGEKPDRGRDTEFENAPATRAEIMAMWDAGWNYLFEALTPLTDADLSRTITISNRAAFGDASYQPADCTLFVSCGADRLCGEAFCGKQLANAVGSQEQVARV